jgi:hypothetical protein
MDYSVIDTSSSTKAYKEGISGLFKIFTIFLTILIALLLITVDVAYLMSVKSKFAPKNLNILATYPYTNFNSASLGDTFTPMAKLPLTINKETQEHQFLIDSGAIASTIPKSEAAEYQIDLTQLPRIIIQGVTAAPSYGFLADAQVTFGNTPINLPILFTDTDQYILGVTGIFDHHTLIFDHQAQSVSIAAPK